MKFPNPPFLELCFYFGDTPEPETFINLIRVLNENGSRFAGAGYIHRGHGINSDKFASIHDKYVEEINVYNMSDVEKYTFDPNNRLVKVFMNGAAGVTEDTVDIVTYLSISPEAAVSDRHPIAILTSGAWTEWELYTEPPRKDFKEHAKELGGKVYHRFIKLVKVLRPVYAAITVEYDLECLTDLRRDPRSLAFCDFFVNQNYFGNKKILLIRDLFAEAYIETIENGIYVSCLPELNPYGRGIGHETAFAKSVEVATLITSV